MIQMADKRTDRTIYTTTPDCWGGDYETLRAQIHSWF
jgi:hypothetical protein